MSYFLGTGAAMSQGNVLAVHDEERTPIFAAPAYGWNFRLRTPMLDAVLFYQWPQSRMSSGDPTACLSADGVCSGRTSGWWDVPDQGYGGMTRPYFINGQTLDSGGSPIAALVQGFTTVGDIYVGEVGSDSNGNYSLPTLYIGLNHYLVAYRAGSPDTAGTTVNTLTPGLTPA